MLLSRPALGSTLLLLWGCGQAAPGNLLPDAGRAPMDASAPEDAGEPRLEVLTEALPGAVEGFEYRAEVRAAVWPEEAVVVWSLVRGPPWLELAAGQGPAVTLHGVPEGGGRFGVELELRAGELEARGRFFLEVTPVPPITTVTSTRLPVGEVGAPYGFDVEIEGGYGELELDVDGVPEGLALTLSDERRLTLSGVPRMAGHFTVAVAVADLAGNRADWTWTLEVVDPLVLVPFDVGDVRACAFFERSLQALGGQLPIEWHTDVRLPEGLSLEVVGPRSARLFGSVAPGPLVVALSVTDARGVSSSAHVQATATEPDPGDRWLVYVRESDPGTTDDYGVFAVDVCLPHSGPPQSIGYSPTMPVGGLARSHDRRRVSFLEFGAEGAICVVDLAGPTPGPRRALAPAGWAVNYDYRFSPDDRWITFSTFRTINEVGIQVYIVEVDAPNPTPRPVGLSPQDGYENEAGQFSLDSQWLAFLTTHPSTGREVRLVPTATVAPSRRIFPPEGLGTEVRWFRWLTAQRLLVFHRRFGVTAPATLSVVDVADPAAPVVTEVARGLPEGGSGDLEVSADGRRAYWSDVQGQVWYSDLTRTAPEVHQVLGIPVSTSLDVSSSPRGELALVAETLEPGRIYLVDTSSTPRTLDLTALTRQRPTYAGPWDPLGRQLYYLVAQPGGAIDTYAIDLQQPTPTSTRVIAGYGAIRISQDGRWIMAYEYVGGLQYVVLDAWDPAAGARALPDLPTLAGRWSWQTDRHLFKTDGASLFSMWVGRTIPHKGWIHRINVGERGELRAAPQHPVRPMVEAVEVLVGP